MTNQNDHIYNYFFKNNFPLLVSQIRPENPDGQIHPWNVPFENVVQVPKFLQGEELQALTESFKN